MTELITPPADDAPQKEKELYKLIKLCSSNLVNFANLYGDFLKPNEEYIAEQHDIHFAQRTVKRGSKFIKELNRQFIKNLLFSFIFFIILTPAIQLWLAVSFRFRFENNIFFYLYIIALSILTAMLINAGSLKKELVYSSEANALKEVVSLRKNIFLPVLYILISYFCLFTTYPHYNYDWGDTFTYTIYNIRYVFFNFFFVILLQAYLCYRPLGKLKNEAKQKIEKHKRYLARDDELKKKIAQSHQQLVQFFPNLKKECDLSPELFDYYFDCDLSFVSSEGITSLSEGIASFKGIAACLDQNREALLDDREDLLFDRKDVLDALIEVIERYKKTFNIRVNMILERFKPAAALLGNGKVATAEEALLTAYQQRDLNEDDK